MRGGHARPDAWTLLTAVVAAATVGLVVFNVAHIFSRPSRQGAQARSTEAVALQILLETRSCPSPALDAYAHVNVTCIKNSPTARWWREFAGAGERRAPPAAAAAPNRAAAVGLGLLQPSCSSCRTAPAPPSTHHLASAAAAAASATACHPPASGGRASELVVHIEQGADYDGLAVRRLWLGDAAADAQGTPAAAAAAERAPPEQPSCAA